MSIRLFALHSARLMLTHWARVTYICVSELTIIGSDTGLAPSRRQTIIWAIIGILLIGPLGTNIREILIGIQIFSFKKIHLKMSSAKWRPCMWSRPQSHYIPRIIHPTRTLSRLFCFGNGACVVVYISNNIIMKCEMKLLIWEWISHFTPHFIGHVIIYPNERIVLIIYEWINSGRYR